MQKNSYVRQNVLALLAALIWGTAFVAQSVSTEYVETFTFNACRGVIAFCALLVIDVIFRMLQKSRKTEETADIRRENPHYRRDLALSGLCCGVALTLGTAFQQAALATTTAGKAGFITALYIVIVPLAGMFFHRKVRATVWGGVALAVGGLYCLCMKENFSVTEGDFFLFLCAFAFAGHILLVDHFTQKVDGVDLSCLQQLVMALLSAVGMLALETPSWDGILHCAGPLLYMGVFSGGLAYTFQILAQKDANPTVVSLLMSLEALVATVAGAVILGDRMSAREYLGCGLMLSAVILAQLPARKRPQDLGCAAKDPAS